jgi:hypothetical protein
MKKAGNRRYNRAMPSPATEKRLETERNIWIAAVRPDGRPHLTPVWFAWHGGNIYICIPAESVKAQNFSLNPKVSCALESGTAPVICEGSVNPVELPGPLGVAAIFKAKYNWDFITDHKYQLLLRVQPDKWLVW